MIAPGDAGADAPDLRAITRGASQEAGGVPADLLGDYLPAVLAAARTGRRLTSAELAGDGRSGEHAAETGVDLRGLVDFYLSATWRLWRELPAAATVTAVRAAGLAVLRAADDAVAAAAEGFGRAQLSIARRQEAERIEFLDDLLSGRGTMADLADRGAAFGLRLAGPHQVVLAAPSAAAARTAARSRAASAARPASAGKQGVPARQDGGGPTAGGPTAGGAATSGRAAAPASGAPAERPAAAGHRVAMERLINDAVTPAPSLSMTRAGRVVAVIGVVSGNEAASAAEALVAELGGGGQYGAGRRAANRPSPHGPTVGTDIPTPDWRVAIGRPYAGPSGVLRSYGEATDALDIADRLVLADQVLNAGDFLMYRVLLRDRAALGDLVSALLAPLNAARDGAGPLLDTLEAYFASGQVVAQAARRLHLSVRAVTYRLARVEALTGKDPTDPAETLGLQVAVAGARLLDWPAIPLDSAALGVTATTSGAAAPAARSGPGRR